MNYKYNPLYVALFCGTLLAIALMPKEPKVALAQSNPSLENPYLVAAEDNTLPIEVQSAVLEAAAGQTSRAVASLKILSSQRKNWPNSCLGFTQPGEVCGQAVTPGWQIVVTDGLRNWTYRTNDAGDLIRLEPSQ